MDRELRIGELAKRSGLTVRTLHWYEEIGLLEASYRTSSGHRRYTADDVLRLQQVVALRQLGMSLEEIGRTLDRDRPSPADVIERLVDRLRDELEQRRRLLDRLEHLERGLRRRGQASIDDLLTTMGEMTMFEKYFTDEQREALAERADEAGEEAIEVAQQEWPRLIAESRELMEAGVDPKDERVQRVAARWRELVAAFSGGDAGIERSVGTMYRENPDYGAQMGLDMALFEYIGKA